MSHSHEDERFSDDLEQVADALRDGRPMLDPLALDRVKLRAMSAASRSGSRPGGFMRQRLTTLLAVGFLVLGTGGTLALAGGVGGSGAGSASFSQYKPPCVHGKGLGVPNECPGEKAEPPPCVHGKGRGVPHECPGEKAGKAKKGSKGSKGGKGNSGGKAGKGSHGSKSGGKGKGGKGTKRGHGRKSTHRKTARGHH